MSRTKTKLDKAGELVAKGNFNELGRSAYRSIRLAVNRMRRIEVDEPPESAVPWFQELYMHRVHDQSEVLGKEHRGIYSTGFSDQDIDRFLHEQFRAGAKNHASRYESFDIYENIFRTEFEQCGISETKKSPLTILDVGSGAGNTVIPLLKIFENIRLLASELSPEMLVMLRTKLAELGLLERCSLLQLNAQALAFRPNSFDLVTGGGILHHLFYPELTINGCYQILKPGGMAFFFEPMKSGNRVLQLLFETMMETCYKEMPDTHRAYLNELLINLDNQSVPDKENSIFKAVDDKWMFSRWQLEKWGADAGFEETIITPMYGRESMLENQARHIFEVYAGLSYDLLPQSARDLVREMEQKLPCQLKSSLLIEATVVFKKAR